MTRSSKSPWEKLIEKRTSNIGFITRTNAFREPTPAEIARAIIIETQSWQETKGKKTYHVSAEYKTPMGHGFNLMQDTVNTLRLQESAMKAYVETPMDSQGVLRSQGINVAQYENPPGVFQRIKSWFTSQKGEKKTEENQFVKYFMNITKGTK